MWNKAVATGEPFKVEFRLHHHGGHYHAFETHASALCDVTGRIVKWFGLNTAIPSHRPKGRAGKGPELAHPRHDGGAE
jgi:hypothetical protein